ncbi:sorting nexin-8 [Halyomorpha halys]|uniref:sorting nexin-8 n=1 Tax=Halyomorpha halys TaxID=286706 RepID=UPI0006D524A5|nr:sorting nexin-8-like [Halyomorpha halys]
MAENDSESPLIYKNIESIDDIDVDIIPEKKGLFIKHVEYVVTSKRFSSQVFRRYNDFVAFYELLLCRFPYRLIPKLPPKKVVGVFPSDSNFLENRRKGLCRWLTLMARHPVVSQDTLLSYFLTQNVPDLQSKIKDVFKNIPDEFTTSHLASRSKDLVPPNNSTEFALSRAQIKFILAGVLKIKEIADHIALRSHGYSTDMDVLGSVLNELGTEYGGISNWGTGGNNHWKELRKGLGLVSKEFTLLSKTAQEQARKEEDEVCERLSYLLDVLSGHSELCERVERGVSYEHQNALSKMLTLKKRQIQGVLRGSDAESVATLENRMLEQESVIESVELRTAFSLYCVRMETQLVHTYLETLVHVLNSLVTVQINSHTELARVWNVIFPIVNVCLSPNRKDKM